MYTRSRIRDLAYIRLSRLDLIRIFCTHIMKNSYSTSASSERNVEIVQNLRRDDIQVAGHAFRSAQLRLLL